MRASGQEGENTMILFATNERTNQKAWSDGENIHISNGKTVFGIDGDPMNIRWECSVGHWNHYDEMKLSFGWKKEGA